ncbi:B12-binding domain-containing radical SAM protein [Chrysiogenes arsenatis]|uniref:B12-binding domain-containing radical SAM protein n=1 Tax=Chrysiogenes arsenatis TaxID=309797 RepID=UPI0004212796|nr:radical SAM protein [Chrysiogenes arsenatis]
MLEILLINTSYPLLQREYSSFGPPLGILSIASALLESGFKVTFVDPQVQPDYDDIIESSLIRGPLFVGMSAYLGENIQNALRFTRKVKNGYPEIPVVWGGPVASSLPENCIIEGGADYTVIGAGESTVVQLAHFIQNGDLESIRQHQHISVALSNGTIKKGTNYTFCGDLDDLPAIRLDLWEKGIERYRHIPIITSRGCPHRCAFCYNTFAAKGKFFLRSGKSVICEMHYWHNKFNISNFVFMDDNFLLDEARSIEIFQAAFEYGYKIGRVYGHLNNFTPSIQDILCQNKISVTMCIESGSHKIRQLLNKNINIDKALKLIQKFTSFGINFTTAFMFGLPTEDDNDIRQSIEVAAQVKQLSCGKANSMFYLYAPQPDDKIIIDTNQKEGIDFSLAVLSRVEVVPVPPTNFIDLRMRPWMTDDDSEFYLALTQLWLYYFTNQFRITFKDFDPQEILSAFPRLKRLFSGLTL